MPFPELVTWYPDYEAHYLDTDNKATGLFREGLGNMVNEESNGNMGVSKHKASGLRGAQIKNVKRTWKIQRQIDDIFGKELEGAVSSIECSMCGEVGFQEQLLHCSRCHERQQHSYCSVSYRESNDAGWVCDWCRPNDLDDNSCHDEHDDDGKEFFNLDKQEFWRRHMMNCSSTVGPRIQSRLDLLVEVASMATAGIVDVSAHVEREMEKELVRRTTDSPASPKGVDSSPTKLSSSRIPKAESSPSKPSSSRSPKAESSHSLKPSTSSSGKRKQAGSGPDRWSSTQKRTCTGNYGTCCAQIGIESNLAKGFGRRYRSLSSMLC